METITTTTNHKPNQQLPSHASNAKPPRRTPKVDPIHCKTLQLLFLAVVIISIVRAASAQPIFPQHASIKRLTEKPTAIKEQLILPSGPTTVDAENAIYTVTTFKGVMSTPITVFRDERTKQIWVGQQCDAYASTEHGIIGFKVFAGSVCWTKPMLNTDTLTNSTSLNDIWKLVDAKIDSQMLLNFNAQPLFREVSDDNFRWQSLAVSCSGSMIKLNSVTPLENNAIQIDITIRDGQRRAIGIFDDQTLALKKATLDGKQVFPK